MILEIMPPTIVQIKYYQDNKYLELIVDLEDSQNIFHVVSCLVPMYRQELRLI